jgi:hypothetical protein
MHWPFVRLCIYIIIGLLISCSIFYLWLPWSVINIKNINWLPQGDPWQHFTGWLMFKNSDWDFPIMHQSLANYPYGLSAVYTDSNPLFSIIFKLLSPIFPNTFQFIGLWCLFCITLNYLFAYKLVQLFCRNFYTCCLYAIIFVLFPPLFVKVRHSSLLAHFIIIGSLYVYFRQDINSLSTNNK